MENPSSAEYRSSTSPVCTITERPRSLKDLGSDREELLDSVMSTTTTIRSAFEHRPISFENRTDSGPFAKSTPATVPAYVDRALRSPGHPRRAPDPTSALGYQIHKLSQQLIGLVLHLDSPSERAAVLDKLANSVAGAQLSHCLEAVERSRVAQAVAASEPRPKFARIDPERVAVDIVSVELRQNQRSASDMVTGALELHGKFPRLWNRMVDGDLPAPIAIKIAKRLRNVLDPVKRSTIEGVFLNRMDRDKSPARWNSHLSTQLDRVIADVDPDGVDVGEVEAEKKRRVSARPSRSGMASLSARLPALDCATITERLDAISNEWKSAEGEERCSDELRADALVQLVTGIDKTPAGSASPLAGTSPTIQPKITLVADVAPSQGRCRAWVGGASVAKSKIDQLLTEASRAHLQVLPTQDDVGLRDLKSLTTLFERIGADFKEQTTYSPSESTRRLVIERDGTCRHPGCAHPASDCDLDHVIPFNKDNPLAGGLTREDNLISLCRHHHRFKTHGNCSYRLDPDGTVHTRIGDDCVGSSSPQGHRGILREDSGAEYRGTHDAFLQDSTQLAQAAWILAAQLDALVTQSVDSSSSDAAESSEEEKKVDVIELRSSLREKEAHRYRENAARNRWSDGIAGTSAIDLDGWEF